MSNKNIIFKFNYNDKWFDGACSEENITYNIRIAKRVWCSDDNCACKQFLDGNCEYSEIEAIMAENDGYVCYESKFFRDWKAHIGWDNTGQGRPRKLPSWVRKNSLSVITTREQYAKESERMVIAVFLVESWFNGSESERKEGYVEAHKKYRIKFTPDEAKNLLLWKYFVREKNNDIRWNRGLARPFKDDGAAALLSDIVKVKQRTQDAGLAKEFFEYYCELNGFDPKCPPKADGALYIGGE